MEGLFNPLLFSNELGSQVLIVESHPVVTHLHPKVLLSRGALNPFIPQPVSILGVTLAQVKHFTLGFVEPHEIHMEPLLKLV